MHTEKMGPICDDKAKEKQTHVNTVRGRELHNQLSNYELLTKDSFIQLHYEEEVHQTNARE